MRFLTMAFPKALGGTIAVGSFLLSTAPAAEQIFPADQIAFFEKNVRPILAENCQECHGAHKHQSGLRLDSREAVMRGTDYKKVVEAGNPEASLLIKAVRHAPGAEPMPNKKAQLSQSQIDALTAWIKMGAPWPKETVVAEHKSDGKDHWAFQKVQKPAIPAITDAALKGQTTLDAFVASKLAAAKLDFSPAADRMALGKRLYVTLTGLMPTFEELEQFVHDKSPDATSQLVDKLLNSPKYGERWARHWLDIVRYSDTEGYTAGGRDNRYAHAYTYRDWVVKSLNHDLPYDQFLIQQLAADKLLPAGKTDPSLAALGLLSIGDSFQGDGLLQNDDRIDVVSRGMIGLTVACARCHDHKYDPIPAKDYYAFYSVFNSLQRPQEMPVIAEASSKEAAEQYKKDVDAVDAQRRAFRAEVYGDIRKSERLREYLVFVKTSASLENEAFRGEAGKKQLRDRFASKWREFMKRFALQDKPHPVMVAWKKFAEVPEAEFAAKAPEIVQSLTKAGVVINPVVRNELAKRPVPQSFSDVAAIYADVFLTCVAGKEPDNADWKSVRTLIDHNMSPMSVPVEDMKAFFTRKDTERMTQLDNQIKKLELTSPGAPDRAMVMEDRPKPADVRVMIRGNPGRPGELAPRGYLTLFGGQKFKEGSGRLELANLIASKDNPLTARVIVNRVWMHHFGRPLVSQTSDFGVQTAEPEQVALLDYLAATFMEQGWSLKNLHRLILNSRTYQQSSMSTPEKDVKDADNLLLSRFNRQRLDYETLRDAMLESSGVLDDAQMGGRSVPLKNPEADTRRSVYLFVDRYEQATVPAMFDFANPDTHSPQRFVTTVPQQTLFLMNSPFMRTRAEQLASKAAPADKASQLTSLTTLYRKVLLRDPTKEETKLAESFLNDSQEMQAIPPFSWTYGSQDIRKDETGKLVLGEFKKFKHFTKRGNGFMWSPGPKIPDPQWSHCFLDTGGGHPGKEDVAPVSRWTAPSDGFISITGQLRKESKNGNGVHGWIISGRTGLVKDKIVAPAKGEDMGVTRLEVEKGEVLSFAVTCERDTNSDAFSWIPTISRLNAAGEPELLTNAQRDFNGPANWPVNRSRPQTPLSQLAQVLMMSNEFQFID